jgi:hypothetical protein
MELWGKLLGGSLGTKWAALLVLLFLVRSERGSPVAIMFDVESGVRPKIHR